MHIRALLIPLLLAPAVLWSADEKTAGPTLRCRAFAVGKAPSEALYVKVAGRYEPMRLSADYIGKSFRTETKDGIVFYRKLPESKSPDGKKTEPYAEFCSCKPDGKGRQLVFFTPDTGNTWKAFAKSDSDGNFSAGTRLVFNLSRHVVAFDFGGTKLAVKPHQSALLLPPAKSEQGVAPVRIAKQGADGNWMPVSNTAWLHQANARKIVLIYPHGEEKISITSIQDTIEAKDDEELGTAPKKQTGAAPKGGK